MARVSDIKNQWGRQGGPNPQRSDLWQVDLSGVVAGLRSVAHDNAALVTVPYIPRYFSASVALPEQKIKSEVIRRDSRQYNMPSWDEPLDAIRFTFIMDDGGSKLNPNSEGGQSTIYTILDVWRSVVRAGRGAVGNEPFIRLDKTYRIDYAFPVYVYLLKGQSLPEAFTQYPVRLVSNPMTGDFGLSFQGGYISEETVTAVQKISTGNFSEMLNKQAGLEVSGILRLENAWLAGFKVADLAYDRSTVLTVEANIYAENILQIRRADSVPSFL